MFIKEGGAKTGKKFQNICQKGSGQLQNNFTLKRNHSDSTGDVMLEVSAKSASTQPKSN